MAEGDTPAPDTSACSRPASDPADEARIFQVFEIELRDVLRRLAESINAFIERVEISFSSHAILPCRCSLHDDPHARGAWYRVQTLRGDAVALLITTVESYGLSYPTEREPFTCERVIRQRPPGPPIADRTLHFHELLGWVNRLDELLGWLTPNEQFLYANLKLGIVVLEERAAVTSRQLGLTAHLDADGKEQITACPWSAESDQSISQFYPLLVRPELRSFQMAVSDANLRDLREKVPRLLAWRPVLESSRILDPGWRSLGASYLSVIQTELREPLPTSAQEEWVAADDAANWSGLSTEAIRKRAKSERWPIKKSGRMNCYQLERLTRAWPHRKFWPPADKK